MTDTLTGRIHSFQSMGAVDGPGLRCVVFMQGCPLRCIYCHNPDTWSYDGGTEVSPEELVQKILRYRSYIAKGGVTVTGGEPLMQSAFVAELFRQLHAHGIHTALDTSCIGNPEGAKEVLRHTDLVLADVKFLSSEEYRYYCGGQFKTVQRFLELVNQMGIPMWIRQVIIPELNDRAENILALKDFLQNYASVEKVELLPFRKLCLEKYDALGLDFPLRDAPEATQALIHTLTESLPPQWRE